MISAILWSYSQHQYIPCRFEPIVKYYNYQIKTNKFYDFLVLKFKSVFFASYIQKF